MNFWYVYTFELSFANCVKTRITKVLADQYSTALAQVAEEAGRISPEVQNIAFRDKEEVPEAFARELKKLLWV